MVGQESHTISRFDKLRFKTKKKPITSENKALVRQTFFFKQEKKCNSLLYIFFSLLCVIMLKLRDRVKVNAALLGGIRNEKTYVFF